MTPRPVVVAHPSPDLYGADLQMLVTVDALRETGHEVLVVLPTEGPLTRRLKKHGARVELLEFPVLRKALLDRRRLPAFVLSVVAAGIRGAALLRRHRASVLLVNTVTLPSWMLAGRLAGVRVLAHVHEAEEDQPRLVRTLLAGQLLLAHGVVVNSEAARRALVAVLPWLARRLTVVHNGVPRPQRPPEALRSRGPADPVSAVLVGRLSPRKGTDVALEAVGSLRTAGYDVRLELCGSVFTGYEWFEDQLRERASRSDLAGAVTFHGYVDPGPVVARSDVVLVPSRVEPFGNVAVEAMHARRPVVASAVQGLTEVVRDGETGILVPPGDSDALAQGILRAVSDPAVVSRLTEAAFVDAAERFSCARYAREIRAALTSVTSGR